MKHVDTIVLGVLSFLLIFTLIFISGCKSNPKLEPVIEPGDNTVVENITGDSGNNGNSVDSGNGGNIGDNGNSSNSGGVGNNSSSDDNRSTPKGNAVWLKYHGRFIPVSHMVDGKQQLLNDESEWYFDVEERTGLIYDLNKAGNTDKAGIMDKAVIHDTRKMYAGSEQNPHDDPLARGAWLDFLSGELGDEIAISGNWEPFVVKVRYECYSLHTQPNNQAWKDYFDARIKEVSATTPLIIKNAWFFDIDSDGREESVVNANNTVYEEELEMSPPVLENTAVYTFTAYFGGDGTVIELDGYAATDEVALEPISDQSDVTVSYMVDENYQGYFEQYVAAYQYDINGGLMLCPVFDRAEYDRWPEKYIILADIDGDGKAELLTMRNVIYAAVTVYHFDENWRPRKQFSIITPA
jgi:hypothetical protein